MTQKCPISQFSAHYRVNLLFTAHYTESSERVKRLWIELQILMPAFDACYILYSHTEVQSPALTADIQDKRSTVIHIWKRHVFNDTNGGEKHSLVHPVHWDFTVQWEEFQEYEKPQSVHSERSVQGKASAFHFVEVNEQ